MGWFRVCGTGSKSAADAVNDLESELSSKLGDDLLVR